MEIILANSTRHDIMNLQSVDVFDVDVGNTNDFQLVIDRSQYIPEISNRAVVYIPNTEYGGVIGEVNTDTSLDTFTFYGMTWRGILKTKFIIPPSGQDYKLVSGDLAEIISDIIDDGWTGMFIGDDTLTGVTVSNYQFDRYCSVYDGLKKLCNSVNYRLELKYIQMTGGIGGYVEVSAVPIDDRSEEIELSQDSRLNFRFDNKYNGVTTLILLGQGELSERMVRYLYVQSGGTIGTTKYYTGNDEIQAVFDYPNAESEEELITSGTERLMELMSRSSFEMDVETLDIDVAIDEIIGGRDYISGLSMSAPVESKVWLYEAGEVSIDYTLATDPNIVASGEGNLYTVDDEVLVESQGRELNVR